MAGFNYCHFLACVLICVRLISTAPHNVGLATKPQADVSWVDRHELQLVHISAPLTLVSISTSTTTHGATGQSLNYSFAFPTD
jgi:hypothetical protein